LIDLDGLLRATTKKVVHFFEEKSAPQTKSYATLLLKTLAFGFSNN